MDNQISQKDARTLAKKNESQAKAIARIKKEGQAAMEAGIRTGAGMASAFGVSYIETRYPDKNKVFGIELSLLVGIGATAAGAFNLVGDKQASEVFEAVGMGALAAFAARKGAEMGAEALAKG